MPDLIFYDTETTGTQIDKDRIVEIAAYNGTTGASFQTLVNPEIPIPAEATKIHGITTAEVADAPKFPEAYRQFSEFCGTDNILVAHNNNSFDYPLLLRECHRHGLPEPKLRTIDSLKCAKKYRTDLPQHSLQYLRQVYGFEENQAHRALDDVITLHRVFSALVGDLSPDQIYDLLNETCHPRIFKMPFGKYKGKPLSEVPSSYIAWLQKGDYLLQPENKEIKAAIEAYQQLK